jgi:hypothetical protein
LEIELNASKGLEKMRFDAGDNGNKTPHWYSLAITSKCYNLYAEIVKRVGTAAGRVVLDQRSEFDEAHNATLTIAVFIDIPDDDKEAEEFFDMSGATYYVRDIAKEHGGKWDGSKRAWEGIAMGALPPLLIKCKDIGITVTGNHLTGESSS